jgi:hypothetical protein
MKRKTNDLTVIQLTEPIPVTADAPRRRRMFLVFRGDDVLGGAMLAVEGWYGSWESIYSELGFSIMAPMPYIAAEITTTTKEFNGWMTKLASNPGRYVWAAS